MNVLPPYFRWCLPAVIGFVLAVATTHAQRRINQPVERRTIDTLVDGHSGHLWIIRIQEESHFGLLHRYQSGHETKAAGAAETVYIRKPSSPGIPWAISAYANRLYVLYQDRTVQVFELRPPSPPHPATFHESQLPPLPGPGDVRFSATSAGPVALITQPIQPDKPRVSPLATATDAPAIHTTTESHQLWRLASNRWHSVPMPQNMRTPRLITGLAHGHVVIIDGVEGADLVSHEWDGTTRWLTKSYKDLPWSMNIETKASSRGKGMVLARAIESDGNLNIDAVALRPSGHFRLGPLGVVNKGDHWWIIENKRQIGLVTSNAQHAISIGGRDPKADPSQAPRGLRPVDEEPLPDASDIESITLAVIGMIFIFMLVTINIAARRTTQPIPPAGYRVASLPRLGAAAIDLLGPLVIMQVRFGLEHPFDIFSQWVMQPTNLENVAQLAMGLGLFVGHTTLTEMIAGTSIGKYIFGLRVVDHSGERPRAWQILVRNAFKVVELIPPPMFPLPLLLLLPARDTLNRPRVGDIFAQTLVVGRAVIVEEENDPDDPS
jgi:uncharacterized RDD family membrane protein YckC